MKTPNACLPVEECSGQTKDGGVWASHFLEDIEIQQMHKQSELTGNHDQLLIESQQQAIIATMPTCRTRPAHDVTAKLQ